MLLRSWLHQWDKSMEATSINEFRIESVSIAEYPAQLKKFKKEFKRFSSTDVKLVFHGTFDKHIGSICENGFDDDRIGSSTDAGWYGTGHYFTSNPEYAVAYTQPKKGVRRLNFQNAIDAGVTVKLLACYVIVGKIKVLKTESRGPIEEGYDSVSVYVNTKGEPATVRYPGEGRAEEIVIPKGARVLPRFVISLTRVDHLIIWRDPQMDNLENSEVAKKLRLHKKIRAICASNQECIRLVRARKDSINYRIVTAGTEGEEFVELVRSKGYYVDILVYCMSVDYHKKWAKKYDKITVTSSTEEMLKFCTWDAVEE